MAQITKAPLSPCILGIVIADRLAARSWPEALWSCGGVELRADGLPPESIAAAVADFDAAKDRQGFRGPVIFTLRLRRDGGAWPDAEAAGRSGIWESLPPGTCDWVDIEVEEIARVSPTALDALRSSGVKILLSHHAFAPESPEAWDQTLSAMRAWKPDGVKFAVTPSDREQVEALLAFARRVAAEFPESCALGMGAGAALTRLLGPLLGCPFTYGYLGTGAVAPGQLPVAVMRAFFARAESEGIPAPDAPAPEWLDWAAALLGKVADAR